VTPDRIVRIVAGVYAILAAAGGVLVLAFVGVLVATFGTNGLFEAKFFFFIVLSGVAWIALSPFIWKGQTWAMIAALAIAIGLTFVFSRETLALRVSLPSIAALFAAFTGLRCWLGKPG
jgi:hypothetical protein